MLQLKSSVKLLGVRPELLLGIMVARDVYSQLGCDLVITACTDGSHSAKSLHYAGCAVDLRTKNVPPAQLPELHRLLTQSLTQDFDVVLESDHAHLEFQPRA